MYELKSTFKVNGVFKKVIIVNNDLKSVEKGLKILTNTTDPNNPLYCNLHYKDNEGSYYDELENMLVGFEVNMLFDFYYSETAYAGSDCICLFKKIPYTEMVAFGNKPFSTHYDLLKIGSGTLKDVSIDKNRYSKGDFLKI